MPTALVRGLVKAGEIEQAWEATGDIVDYYHRAEAAFIIARTTGVREDFLDALALVSHIGNHERKRELEIEILNAMPPD